MTDLFKTASKKKYRFSYKGIITTEDLWDLSVEELDTVYRNLKSLQRKRSEDSLLQTVSEADKETDDKIEIIKTVVADKLAARDKAEKAAVQKAQNQRILEIIADKQDAALKEKSIEELQAMLTTKENAPSD